MRFITSEECARFCEGLADLGPDHRPAPDLPGRFRMRVLAPAKASQFLWFSRVVEAALQPRRPLLVWITDWGVWPSSENLHLYDRFRQAYGELRLLHEAPGHLCMDYEGAEVVTLAWLALLFGWDAHRIPVGGFARAFVSHHGWIEMALEEESRFRDTCKVLDDAGLGVAIPE
jgi:hypothetical protein